MMFNEIKQPHDTCQLQYSHSSVVATKPSRTLRRVVILLSSILQVTLAYSLSGQKKSVYIRRIKIWGEWLNFTYRRIIKFDIEARAVYGKLSLENFCNS